MRQNGGTQWTHEEYQQEKYGIATKHDETKLLKVCFVLRIFINKSTNVTS